MDTATRNEVKRFSQEWGARFTRFYSSFRISEYEESRLKEALVVKDEMQVAITAELIEESIIELYVAM
ncbi:hypothetical protein JG687_00019338, partial [Phytophthora cactorum]